MVLDKLKQDLTEAQKNKDSVRTSVLRLMLSEIHNADIEIKASGKEMSEDDLNKVLLREAKKRRESIEAYKTGGREDLVAEESAELKVIEEYLPEQISQEEIEKVVQEVVSANAGANFGEIMKQSMAKLQGKADGKVVSQVVNGLMKG